MAHITKVTFSKLVSGPDHSNETIGVEAVVEEGELPSLTLEKAINWVEVRVAERTNQSHAVVNTAERLEFLLQQIKNKQRELELAQANWDRVKVLFEKVGIRLPSGYVYDLRDDEWPF